MPKGQFVRSALKKKGVRYSHAFLEAPEVPEVTRKRSSKKDLSSLLNTASTKPREEDDSRDSYSQNDVVKTPRKRKTRSAKRQKQPSVVNSDSESQEESKDVLDIEMDVNTKEPSIIGNNGDEMEFILAIEDMQSAISH